MKQVTDFVLRHRFATIMVLQLFLVAAGYLLAFCLRFDFNLPPEQTTLLLTTLPYLFLCRMASYSIYRLNSGWWRFVSMFDLMNIIKAVTLGTLLFLLGIVFGYALEGFPRSVFITEALLNLILLGGVRFGVRFFREKFEYDEPKNRTFTLVAGAGAAGVQLLHEIQLNPQLGIRVVGFVDDDPMKKNAYIHGVPVLGACVDIPELAAQHHVDAVVITIPSAGYKKIVAISQIVQSCGLHVKVLPSLTDLMQKRGLWGQLRELSYDELLDRPIVRFRRETDLRLLRNEIRGKAVLITGAAGSIGSELATQAARFNPRSLILYERNENCLYFLELKLKERYPECQLVPIIGDLLNEERFAAIVKEYQVDLIYHAAAYKHVPMMQREPFEAVRNNVLATEIVARTAVANQVRKCVYISTDKAVKPSSIMGATKRVGEMIMQAYSGGRTSFITVRFGNVIGSNGSVVQLFQKQIDQGGPITITHPQVTRYFMSISEAVQLVMTAGALSGGNEISLLDMGEPVKIVDLAKRLLENSNLTPGKDIEMKFIGLRPGEKLHEELYWRGENILPTSNKKITVLKTNGLARETLFAQLSRLREAGNTDPRRVEQILQQMVPEGNFISKHKDEPGELRNGHRQVIRNGQHKNGELIAAPAFAPKFGDEAYVG